MSCPICLEVYTDPVVLPCGHSLCRGTCARRIVKKSRIVCPTCRAIHWAPEGVKSLPKNYALEEFIEEKEKQEPLCPDHLSERVNLFCTQCYVPVCVKCCLSQTSGGTTLSRHRQHQVIPLDQMQSYVQGLLSVVRRYLTSRQQGDYWELDRVRATQEDRARTRQLVIRLKLYDVLLAECQDVDSLSQNEGTWAKLDKFRLILKRLDSLPDPLDSLPDPGLTPAAEPEDGVKTAQNPLLEVATGQSSSSDQHEKVHHGPWQETNQDKVVTELVRGKLSVIDQAVTQVGPRSVDERNKLTDEVSSQGMCYDKDESTDTKQTSNNETVQNNDDVESIDNHTPQVGSEEETTCGGQTERSNRTTDSSQVNGYIPRHVLDKDIAKTTDPRLGTEERIEDNQMVESCHTIDVYRASNPYKCTIIENPDKTTNNDTTQTEIQELKSEPSVCNVDCLEHNTEQSSVQFIHTSEDTTFCKEETNEGSQADTQQANKTLTIIGGKEQVLKLQKVDFQEIKDVPKPPDIQAENCTVRDTSISVLWTVLDAATVGYFTVYYETGIFTHGLCNDRTSVVVTEFNKRSGHVTLCDLDPEKRYKVSVTASNNLGESLPSKYLYCRTSSTNPEKCLI